ncbi:MAG TPA: dTDP-4-dehydrorhamnose 3,5-epimerase family protein [Thermomicrobiales bacterium]|jgi:dTDP-4-dehydrorhamnose 3,5-epimerase|nr:dTDP-4-dehydrorhamnose 3,5-epimerase family protein [Thermomicrobiales bacterium]HQZ89612.1 dTDP-4-dehydrorhamnose 3,5-epimerase family protein [Thermomicrobiales bacterium]HRA32076.1 dTDP-4-dehydrorhamnose 3,5-epimerase family protein [Thermomicrobiales bacterium]
MATQLIDGVEIKRLVTHADERGQLTELIRRDDPFFEGFGQCYFSVSYPGVIRGWHYHKKQTDYFTCISGMIKVPLYDMRDGSPTYGVVNEFFIGDDNRIVVKIPIGVLHGFKNVGVTPCYLVNFPTTQYDPADPDEYRVDWDSPEIPYSWDLKFT